ncbi:MAG: phosphoribosylglycinamide formyltransferase [SAR324 cluster bacterium]|nr:phosphoribosylglycinamide formyltransferase [SAR324 cluster bacterium]
MKPFPVGVLVSGSGTNLQAIINAQEKGDLPISIQVVISNKESAYALERAKNHGIPSFYISHKQYESREKFDQAMHEVLVAHGVELIVLAGFMRLVSPWFVTQWKMKIINTHPALVPSFPGVHAAKQALEYGVKITGCSVFFVDDGVDTGPVIIQAAVPVLSEDTEDSLQARIQVQEHQILPQAIHWIANKELKVEGRKIITPPILHR